LEEAALGFLGHQHHVKQLQHQLPYRWLASGSSLRVEVAQAIRCLHQTHFGVLVGPEGMWDRLNLGSVLHSSLN
jgi:hypothetical protein